MSKRTMSKFKIALIIILVTLVGVFGYLYLSGKYKPTGPLKKVSDETAGWKTYTNTEYGFEFKYPNNWAVSESQKRSLPYLVFIVLAPKDIIEDVGGFFSVAVGDETENQFSSFVTQRGDYYVISKTDTSIGNKRATLYVFGRNDSSEQVKVVIVQREGYLLKFSNGGISNYGDIFNEILPTFKFTN